ncbi:Retrovirus-related Pol poly, partial [Paramuricea clavata]
KKLWSRLKRPKKWGQNGQVVLLIMCLLILLPTQLTHYLWGKDGHTADKCGAISLNCRQCGKVGHLARVCRSNSSDQRRSSSEKPRGNKKHQKSRKIWAITSKNWLQESTSEDDDFEPVHRLNSKDSSVQVAINEHAESYNGSGHWKQAEHDIIQILQSSVQKL